MFKNTGSQKLTVLAFADAGHGSLDAGDRVTGDAANITMKVEQDDDGTQTASNDTNPTEVEDGQYRFDLTQAETNGDKLTFYPESATAGVQVVALPSNVIYTRPPNFPDLGIASDGDLTKVNTLDGHTAQTGDSFSRIGSPAGASVSADIATVDANVDTLLARITSTLFSGITSLAEWLGLMAGKQTADATAKTEIQATGGGSGTYDESTDSLEAIRDTAPLGTAMRGTDSALLASSAPTNWSSMGIESDGHVHSDLKEWLGTAVTLGSGAPDVNIASTDDIDLSATQKASVNAEVDNALDTAIPGVPTADSINERIAAIDDLTQSGGSGDLAAVLTDTNSLNDTKIPQTLNLTASGNIGIDWANVENPTSIVDLSATDIQLVDTATDVTNSVTVGTNNDKTGYSLSSSGMDSVTLPASIIDANALATDAVNEIADGVWDEVITGAQHNVQNSAAKFLRESSEAAAMVRGTAQGATANTLQLESGDVTNDDILNFERVSILEGTGTGQERIITDSDAGTDTITVDRNWKVNPDSSSVYAIGGASSDVRAISGSKTAAGNALAFFDNSGFNASNSTIGTATNVTTIADGAVDSAVFTDIFNTQTFALPGQGAPTATPTVQEAIAYLYKRLRNKSDFDGTTEQLFADDGSTVDHKRTVSESSGTVTHGKLGSGP